MILLSIQKLHIPTEYFPPFSRDNFLEVFCIIVHPSLTLACWSFWSLFHIKFLFVWKSGQKPWKSRKVFEGRLFLYRFVFSHILSILSTTPQHFSRIYTALHFCYLRLSMAIFLAFCSSSLIHTLKCFCAQSLHTKIWDSSMFSYLNFFVIHESIENGLRPCVWTNDEGLTASENSNTHF